MVGIGAICLVLGSWLGDIVLCEGLYWVESFRGCNGDVLALSVSWGFLRGV